MQNTNPNAPVYIIPQDSSRTSGRDAQRINITAAQLVAETVRTTLGPRGMDKMLVDALGEVTVTNDGVTILEQMDLQHPIAKMIVQVAKTQENEVGDGTTTAVVLAGAMLREAEKIIDKIHPTIIAKGYRLAEEQTRKALQDIVHKVTLEDTEILQKIAHTAMTGKGAEDDKDHLSQLVMKAIKQVAYENKVKRESIKIETQIGGRIEESKLIQGIVLDKERVHSEMPNKITGAKIALLDTALEIRNTEIDARISITDPEKLQAFLDMEEQMLRKMVDKIVSAGANVVFCQKGIDDLAQHFLAKKGILAARRVKKSDMQRLAKATGAKIITNLDDLDSQELGSAGTVKEVFNNEDGMLYVQDCEKTKAVTILVRAGTEHVAEEIRRALDDAIGDVSATINSGFAVAGAGAPETYLAKKLNEYASTLSGREQLAVQAYAAALEIIPSTLAENAGIDPIDVLTSLKAAHERGEQDTGINVFTGKTMDAWSEGVIEPLKVKSQALSSATEVATMILRIDDVIVAEEDKPPAGGHGHHH